MPVDVGAKIKKIFGETSGHGFLAIGSLGKTIELSKDFKVSGEVNFTHNHKFYSLGDSSFALAEGSLRYGLTKNIGLKAFGKRIFPIEQRLDANKIYDGFVFGGGAEVTF